MKQQKFHKGDLVKIAVDLSKDGMSHFESDCEAIVIGSYNDQFGGGNITSYTLHIKDHGEVSWYYEHQLMLIEANRLDLLKQWEDEMEREIKEKSNLDWIFSHGQQVIDQPIIASYQALANCFGLTDLWGPRGEGIDLYTNAMMTRKLATSFLKTGNKDGWIEFANTLKGEMEEKMEKWDEIRKDWDKRFGF